MRHVRLATILLALLGLLGCEAAQETEPGCVCEERGLCLPTSGEATLYARSTYDDYEAATFSFEHASVEDNGVVGNDWDILFGNDGDWQADELRVNTVVDDRSLIVDFGPVSLDSLPEVLVPGEGIPLQDGYYTVPAVLGHLYLVRTLDSNTRQYAAFRVIAHRLNDSMTIRWYRSSEPDRFVLPAPR